MKAQSMIELLVVISIGLTIIFSIFNYANVLSKDDVKLKKAEIALQQIKSEVNSIYSLNPGSSEKITIDLPEGIVSYNLTGHKILYKLSLSSGNTEIFVEVDPKVNGSLPISEGKYVLDVQYVGGDIVQIS